MNTLSACSKANCNKCGAYGTTHNFSDGIYAKEMRIPKGYVVGKHQHEYSHLSILAKGHVIVNVDGELKEFHAPACIEIVKNKDHSVEALEDSVWYCIHATEETDPSRVDEVLIGKK